MQPSGTQDEQRWQYGVAACIDLVMWLCRASNSRTWSGACGTAGSWRGTSQCSRSSTGSRCASLHRHGARDPYSLWFHCVTECDYGTECQENASQASRLTLRSMQPKTITATVSSAKQSSWEQGHCLPHSS